MGLALVALALTSGSPPPVHPAAARIIHLGGVRVSLRQATRQVITVNGTRRTHARITLWQLRDGHWRALIGSRAARTGYGGLVAGTRRHQGTGTTPLGTYPLLFTFGTGAAETGSAMRYTQVGPEDYWVEDNTSPYYNRYRSKAAGGFRYWLNPRSVNGSERLAAYPGQYRLAVVIGYNYSHPVRYHGAGIFLHVNGPGATAGCVSTPLAFLQHAVADLDPAQHPVIAIGS